MFAPSISGVLASKAHAVIEADVIELCTPAEDITDDKLLEVQKATMNKLEAMDGYDYLPQRAEVVISYRGEALPIRVSSVAEHVALAMHALVKGLAVEQGTLPRMYAEDWICTSMDWNEGLAATVPEKLVKASQVARKAMGDSIANCGGTATSDILLQLVRRQGQGLLSTDPHFKVETAALTQLVGPKSDLA